MELEFAISCIKFVGSCGIGVVLGLLFMRLLMRVFHLE